MGNSQSRQLSVCPYCTTELDFSSISINDNNSFICGRCNGTIQKIQPRKTPLSRLPILSSTINDNLIKDTESFIPIKYIHIGIFENGLKSLQPSSRPEEEKNDKDEISFLTIRF